MRQTFLFIFILFFLVTAVSQLHGQYVSTLLTGNAPIEAIAVDDSGNVYFAEHSPSNMVKKVTPLLTIENIAQIPSDPSFMVLHKGFLYVTLYTGNKIVRVSLADKSVQDYVTGCSAPYGLVFDGDTLFFGEYFSQRIYKVLPGGGSVGSSNVIPIQGADKGINSSGMVRLMGLEFLPNKNLVVTTLFGGGTFYEVNRFTGQAKVLFTAPSSEVFTIVRGPDNYYYYTGWNTHKIYRVNSEFTTSTVIAGTTAGSTDGDVSVASFNQPTTIVFSRNGDMYVCEYSTKKIRRISQLQPSAIDEVTISGSGIVQLPGANIQIGFTGVSSGGTCSVKVFVTFPANPTFSSGAPQFIAPYSIQLSLSNIQYTTGVIIIPVNLLYWLGYTNVNSVRIFWRPTVGTGTFSEVTWSVNPLNQNEVVITIPGSGEYLFASTTPLITSVTEEQRSVVPRSIELYQNYPNPFNPTTTISFSLNEPSYVVLKVYDMIGREVALVTRSYYEAGTHQVTFHAEHLPSGIYIAHLQAGGTHKVLKMTLLK